MIIYNRDKEGNIDRTSTTFLESQKTVNATVKELLKGTELEQDLKEKDIKIAFLETENLNTQLALVEVFELVILATATDTNAKTTVGGDKMVTVYVSLIIKGAKKFSDVPDTIKPLVRAELESLGLGHLAE